jgi:tRNA modification GTPase
VNELAIAEEDTIAAVATSLGEASVGIVRVSGPEARAIGERCYRDRAFRSNPFTRRTFCYGQVIDPHTSEPVDECIALWMPGPNSYTAEDVLEFQVHGGIHVVEQVLAAVLGAGARLAEPGEFTKRAFLNGRIDLSQAEAVMDLIRAKTDRASRAALSQVKGRLSERIQGLRKKLIHLQAHVEVTIDYPEHDVEEIACQQVERVGGEIVLEVARLAASARMGHILRQGVMTGIVGRPNVGKSSLMNALLRRERAIVTDIPGTTRDVLEEYVNVRGLPFRLVDTAGIRETDDVVERMGVERSRETLEQAELVLVLLNGSEALTEEDRMLLHQTSHLPRIVVVNKADLPQQLSLVEVEQLAAPSPVLALSAQNQVGLAALEESMERMVQGGSVDLGDLTYATNARQGALLQAALEDLEEAVSAAQMRATLDIIAVGLQAAYASLGRVIGEEVGEDLLDEIFSQFCLGK